VAHSVLSIQTRIYTVSRALRSSDIQFEFESAVTDSMAKVKIWFVCFHINLTNWHPS